jgi:hypothetical protein
MTPSANPSLLVAVRRSLISGHGAAAERGSTIIMVLLVVSVLSVVAGGILFSSTARYHSTYQSASWQEALIAADAGVDIAMNELRQQVVSGTQAFGNNKMWTTADAKGTPYTDQGHAFPAKNAPAPFLLRPIHGGEGNSMLATRVYVDVPGSDMPPTPNTSFAQPPPSSIDPFINERRDGSAADSTIRYWYRIRSVGYAGVSGPTRANVDPRDNRLRKFSFFNDWRTGLPVSANTGPNVTRLVEVVAKPLTNFRNALMADKQIDLSNQDVLIDSYDSTKGLYSATIPVPPANQNTSYATAPGSAKLPNGETNPNSGRNIGWLGNIATNGLLINANGANVQGDAMTNDGSVDQGENVVGQQRADFYQDMPPVEGVASDWASVTLGNTVTTSTTYTASTNRADPTRVRLNGISLATGGKTVLLDAPAAGKTATPSPSYIKVFVDGDITTQGDSMIKVADGVNAIFYVSGNIDLQGHGISNGSGLPGRLLINGIKPPDNTDGTTPSRTITIGSDIDFEGIIYAPNHDIDLNLKVVASAVAAGGPTPPPPPSPPPAGNLAKQIQDLQKKANDKDQEYLDHIKRYNDKMADYQKGGDPKKLQEANNEYALAQNAKAAADAFRTQIATLQAPPPAQSGDPHAADAAQGYNGIYGAFAGRTIKVGAKTHIHYDEALRDAGPINHYEIVNWFEDQNSRATVNW